MASSEETIDKIMETENTSEKDKMKDQFDKLLSTLSNFRTQITAMQQEVRLIEKAYNKTVKQAEKDKNEKKRQKQNKKPSGFALPTKISDDLCEFMSKEKGSLVARTDVTRFIINYIKTNDLQDPKNRKYILPDNDLKKLLHISDEELSFFNLQKYMNCHFHKKASGETT